ncbi:rhamnulokinase [Thermoanaerobacterium thermosaccharolyticum]|uniref:rhamnulokinase n=1 Tax=Thermoanaerobacterium thermosaccharolyticum TaxID=1517 RepID=UPI0020A53171|nr:rhamnulokinase family protein [Thermoanaerobacterium thermosaccharolyticum]MCP2240331.1 rhamnulokinase [Thermoanaerobacterium thermosaccharolyticum]
MKMLAFDFGASNGRAILGEINGKVLKLTEVHRFSNDPVMFSNHLQWDLLRLTHEVKQGLLKCKSNGDGDIASIGVDTWGVDFGLLDENGELLSNPYHYRDDRTQGMIDKCFEIISKTELFKRTGLLVAQYNTIYQLMAMRVMKDKTLDLAETLLMMPDLINYMLTGVKVSEYTEVSTSQLYNHETGNWDDYILEKINVPRKIFTNIVKPGTTIGSLRDNVCKELNTKPAKVIAVASHDTASAVAAVPAKEKNYAFISSGTWLLVGIESDKTITNDLVIKYNFTNEGGVNGINFIKNIMGLWILQECKRAWNKEGNPIGFGEMVELAQKEKEFVSFIDPDDDLFYIPGNMPCKIKEFCSKTGQAIPETIGQIVRCVEESLAYKCKWAIEQIEIITSKKVEVIHMVGGGIQDKLLCQLIANSTGKKVIAGPVEATAIGNIMVQAISNGAIKDINDGRKIIRNSFDIVEYIPNDNNKWQQNYERFLNILK